jgi:hypothetical protein
LARRDDMQKIRMNREVVLDKLLSNRKSHKETYLKAITGYREKAIEELSALIDELKYGRTPASLAIRLAIPRSYIIEYDLAIEMLNNSIDDVVELDDIDFRRYIRDEWEWKSSFRDTTSAYTVS